MKRTIYNFLIIGFLLSNHSQALSSSYLADGLTVDLKGLLADRSLPKVAGESLEAELVRDYILSESPNMKFFSHPAKFHQDWKDFLGKHHKQPVTKEIFLALGRLQQAVLNNGQEEYYAFADALNQGITRILQGDLGFRKTPMQESERDIFAKELLVSGRSLGSRVWDRTDQLGFHYVVTSDLKEKRHLQISALLMLAGHDRTLIDDSGWYLKDMNEADKVRLLTWVYGCADRLPARFEAGSVGFQIEEYANNVEFLKPFKGREKQQLKYALIKGLSEHTESNGNIFPDREYLTKAETFFENLKAEFVIHGQDYNIEKLSSFLNQLFKQKTLPNWSDYVTSCNSFAPGTTASFLNIYSHFSDQAERTRFIDFSKECRPKTSNIQGYTETIPDLISAYQIFNDESKRTAFMEFCKPYINQAETYKVIKILMPVYQKLSITSGELESFQEFCKPYFEDLTELVLKDLIEIYQAFDDSERRKRFMSTTYYWFHDVTPQTPGMLKAYLPFYNKDDYKDRFYKDWQPVFQFTKSKKKYELRDVILTLREIDQNLEDKEKTSFTELFNTMSQRSSFWHRYVLTILLSRIEKAYQVFSDQAKREEYLTLDLEGYGSGASPTPEHLIPFIKRKPS